MKYETLEKYDKELNEIKEDLMNMEKYLKRHPESIGTRGNYETCQYIYKIFKEDKIDFIDQTNRVNLILKGESTNNSLNISDFYNLSNHLNETKNILTISSEKKLNQEKLLVQEISEGSYKITYGFENPTEEDVKRTSARKKGLLKIFDFINCGEDIEKLKKEAGPNGEEALKSYKSFLEEIVNLNTDFTLDTEMGTVKAGLTHKQCKNICKNLNI